MIETKNEVFIFSLIIVVVMVFCMASYNAALRMGFSSDAVFYMLTRVWPEVFMAFFVQRLLAAPFTVIVLRRCAKRWKSPTIDALIMTVCNVCVMAPIMTVLVYAMNNGITEHMVAPILRGLAFNAPFAFVMMVLFVRPFARIIFLLIYKKNISHIRK